MPEREEVRGLYVAAPCYGCMMTTEFLVSLLGLQVACQQRGIECAVDLIGNESLVQRARNILAARFLKSRLSHLLFIDADIGFDAEAALRLLDADKDIATAAYPKKAFNWAAIEDKLRARGTADRRPAEPVRMMGLDYNLNVEGPCDVSGGLIRVLDAATGFMLIRRGVLERMAAAYADTLACVNDLPGNRADPGYVTEYVALFDCMIDPKTRRYLSEDFAFVRRAQECGYEIWADVTAPLCHVGTHVFEGDLRQRYQLVYTG